MRITKVGTHVKKVWIKPALIELSTRFTENVDCGGDVNKNKVGGVDGVFIDGNQTCS